MLEFKNPVWGDAAHTYINMEIKLDIAVREHWIDMDGQWIEFSANPKDTEDYGVWLFNEAVSRGGTAEYVAPTIEEERDAMPPVTQRQLRLTLVRNGISLSTVQAALYGMEDGLAKDEAIIEWESASTYNRIDPTLLTIAKALSLSPEAVDAMWEQALAA